MPGILASNRIKSCKANYTAFLFAQVWIRPEQLGSLEMLEKYQTMTFLIQHEFNYSPPAFSLSNFFGRIFTFLGYFQGGGEWGQL